MDPKFNDECSYKRPKAKKTPETQRSPCEDKAKVGVMEATAKACQEPPENRAGEEEFSLEPSDGMGLC